MFLSPTLFIALFPSLNCHNIVGQELKYLMSHERRQAKLPVLIFL